MHLKQAPLLSKKWGAHQAFYEYKFRKSVILSRCLEVIRAVFLEGL